MTVQTDLAVAIDAYIQANFTGSLAEISATSRDLQTLLEVQKSLTSDGGGDASAANQLTELQRLGTLTETAPASDVASSGLNGRLQRIAQRITFLIGLLPASLGAKTAATSLAVTLASDGVAGDISAKVGEVAGSPTANTVLARLKAIADALVFGAKTTPNSISVTGAKATVAPTTSVTSSATSVTLLAANTNRTFASFRNDSTAIAYIEFGVTATTSSVYKLAADGFMSIDNYTGVISCIWASANGNMRISEGV